MQTIEQAEHIAELWKGSQSENTVYSIIKVVAKMTACACRDAAVSAQGCDGA